MFLRSFEGIFDLLFDSTSESNDLIYSFLCSLWGASNLLYMKMIIFSSVSLVIFSARLSGSDSFVLFDSLDGNAAYSQIF